MLPEQKRRDLLSFNHISAPCPFRLLAVEVSQITFRGAHVPSARLVKVTPDCKALWHHMWWTMNF